jgi:hypothetical protein
MHDKLPYTVPLCSRYPQTVYHAYTNSGIIPPSTARLTSLQKYLANKQYFLNKIYIQMKRNANSLSRRVGIEHVATTLPKPNRILNHKPKHFFYSRHARRPLNPCYATGPRRPCLAGRPPPQIPSRLLESWSQSVLSPQKENTRKLVTSTPSPFHFSSSANPRATALGQKFLEGTSLFPPSDEPWAVDIDARLSSVAEGSRILECGAVPVGVCLLSLC